jgi:tetratricopeptide (TPR) repeat protein
VPEAQAYFDQGLRLYYAFNHSEAVRAFRKAQALDPQCGMCWWGEALAWGPNINLPMDASAAKSAYAALQGALERREHASQREQDLIDALATRYAPEPQEDRSALDKAYADAMKTVAARRPNDADIVVLHGEAVMDLQPWDYWSEDGKPRPGMAEALAGFERVVEMNPKHPGACHFYIHAVEKLYPERAVPCAERLANLMPGAGHLVHMPGHIYIRVGRYADAIEQNKHAVHADETWIADQRPGYGMYTVGYYPHNYDFLAFAASMIGRSDQAIESAEKVAELIPAEMVGTEGMDFLQHWSVRPLQMLVRFGRWDEILTYDAPPASLPYARALWHYARGRALAATGNLAKARDELAALRAIATDPGVDKVRMEFNAARDLLAVATRVLAGHIEAAAGDFDKAVAELQAGVAAEDALLYGEPPEWSVPVRQDLGNVLLLAGRPAEAERAFREDLERLRDNGWSLHGLAKALKAQGHDAEAARVRGEFRRVWASADVNLEPR